MYPGHYGLRKGWGVTTNTIQKRGTDFSTSFLVKYSITLFLAGIWFFAVYNMNTAAVSLVQEDAIAFWW